MNSSMAQPGEKTEHALSVVIRFLISLALPLWGLAILVLGIVHGLGWWIVTGLVVVAIGVLLLAGNPLAEAVLGRR